MENEETKKDIVLFLGRFQPLHNGHLNVMLKISRMHEVIIAIGSAKKGDHSFHNPFDFDERKRMIELVLEANNIPVKQIVAIPDTTDDDYVKHVEQFCGNCGTIYTGNDWVKHLFEKDGYTVMGLERLYGISSTNVRILMAEDGDWESKVPEEAADFIRKIRGVERVKQLYSSLPK